MLGGIGLVGSRLVSRLRQLGCEAVAASRSTGVDTLSGVGLVSALVGAQVVIDVTNAPVFEDNAVLRFFEQSTRNGLAAEAAVGVEQHVLLSVIGASRLPEGGYLRAKAAQEALVAAAGRPYTILQAAQFFEFLGAIAGDGSSGDEVRLPPVLVQPLAADDVAAALAEIALGAPVNAAIELAGPEQFQLDDLVGRYLRALNDPRRVVADDRARYFGARLEKRSLLPGENARRTQTRFTDWLEGL